MEPKTELQLNAIALARRKDLENFQRALDIQWLNNRMEDGRMGRCLALIQREAEMEKDFQERTDHAAIVNAKAEKETLLGLEVSKVRQEEQCKLLRRHYLRDRDPSLRELSLKLEAGYVCRDLKQQILHNEYRRLQDKAEDKLANSVLLNALFNDKEAKELEEREKMKRNMQYTKELQQQLVNRQRVKQCMYEDSLIEKKMLEDISRTIADEDQKELQKKREEMAKIRQEMVTFAMAKEAWLGKQRLMIVKEEREIEEQKKAVADRTSGIIAAREEKMRQKEELNQRIAAKIMADEEARLDRENIIKSLQEQEFLEKNHQDDIAKAMKLEFVKNDTKFTLTEQMETKKRLVNEQAVRDLQLRRENEAKLAEDELKEKEKQKALKAKGRLYSQQLLKQIEDNAIRRKADKDLEERRVQAVWDHDRNWRSEVADERKQMVEEHVPRLLGYLQAGVVKQTDLKSVREGCDKVGLEKLDVEAMAVRKGPTRFSKCNPQCRILREF